MCYMKGREGVWCMIEMCCRSFIVVTVAWNISDVCWSVFRAVEKAEKEVVCLLC